MKTRLPPQQREIAGEKWPIVGEAEPRNDPTPWTLSISGQVQTPVQITLQELRTYPQVVRSIDIHCVTRWSKFDMVFQGVLLNELLVRANPHGDAHFASFIARSARDHSSSLPLQFIEKCDLLVATHANDRPLSTAHGGPIRLVVPGKYFYKSVKWLERIELLEADRLGFWESESGYHNQADPWKEQRYVSARLSKQEASRLIQSRDFRDQDLLGIDASLRDLTNLKAERSQLRNADFFMTDLTDASFRDANLSNANFEKAILTGADLTDADAEGADFSGSNLLAARFEKTSLFGATFRPRELDTSLLHPTKIDVTTCFSESSLAGLEESERAYIAACNPTILR